MKKVVLSCLVALGFGLSFQAQAVDAEKAQALAQAKNCLACHKIDIKIVGPSYKQVAAKYKGDASAVDSLAQKVIKGTIGTWGNIPMPPNPVTADEAKLLVQWILSL